LAPNSYTLRLKFVVKKLHPQVKVFGTAIARLIYVANF
jgi:hypothetical protein